MLKLFLFLIAGVCLFSFPVLSGENPWDADNDPDGNDGGNPIDTTHVVDFGDEPVGLSRVTGHSNWYDDLIISTTIYFYEWYYGEELIFSKKQVVQGRGIKSKDR